MGNEYDKPIYIDVTNYTPADKLSQQTCIDEIRRLSNNQKFGVLSTYGEGVPFASLVAFAASDDLKHLVMVTPKNTTKYNNMLVSPKVALLIDNRSELPEAINQISVLTVIGTANIVEDSHERENWKNIYLNKHPNLIDFANGSSSAMIHVQAEKYIYVSNFQQVFEWIPDC